jgi:signal peptidase I
VETSSLNNNSSRDIEIVKAVLESGNSVELPATGDSMFPVFKHGDMILVRPLTKKEMPGLGSVVVCLENGAEVRGYGGTTEEGIRAEDKRHASTGSADQAQDKSEESEDRPSVLVMHRLIEIIDGVSDNPSFITRGDSRPEPDATWLSEQLLGEAVSYKRSGKIYQVKRFVPGFWSYKYNAGFLWIRNMGMRIRKKASVLIFAFRIMD